MLIHSCVQTPTQEHHQRLHKTILVQHNVQSWCLAPVEMIGSTAAAAVPPTSDTHSSTLASLRGRFQSEGYIHQSRHSSSTWKHSGQSVLHDLNIAHSAASVVSIETPCFSLDVVPPRWEVVCGSESGSVCLPPRLIKLLASERLFTDNGRTLAGPPAFGWARFAQHRRSQATRLTGSRLAMLFTQPQPTSAT